LGKKYHYPTVERQKTIRKINFNYINSKIFETFRKFLKRIFEKALITGRYSVCLGHEYSGIYIHFIVDLIKIDIFF